MKLSKKIAAMTTAIVTTLSLCGGLNISETPIPVMVEAGSIAGHSDEMQYGDYITYRAADPDYNGEYDYVNIIKCDTSVAEIDIPSEIDGLPVTMINSKAFYECTELTKVTIPDTVTLIFDYAFAECTNLSEVKMSENLTHLGEGVFENTALLPDEDTDLYYLEPWLIDCNAELSNTTVVVKPGIKGIGNCAFADCWKVLERVSLPPSLMYIDDDAFSWCEKLTDVTIPDSVVSIGESAFVSCSSFEKIVIPDSVKSIGECAFMYCENVTELVIGKSVERIGGSAFRELKELESVIIPESVTYIDQHAFQNCTSLKKIVINNPKCEISCFETTISETAVIYGYSGSTAEEYAVNHEREFIALDEPETTEPTETEPSESTETESVPGDLNDDGVFNICDVSYFDRMLAQGKYDELPSSADYNKDGDITVRDSKLMAGDIVGELAEHTGGDAIERDTHSYASVSLGAATYNTDSDTVSVPVEIKCHNNLDAASFVIEWDNTDLILSTVKDKNGVSTSSEIGEGYCTLAVWGASAVPDCTVATLEFETPDDISDIKNLSITEVSVFAEFDGDDLSDVVSVSGIGSESEPTEPVETEPTGTTVTTQETETVTTTVTDVTETPPGDANGDGEVTVRDASTIARFLAEGRIDELLSFADFNGDGEVSVRDAAAIARWLASGKK
ncbi:MAG: leucine-rich repeat protein [Oscillospiraceae bacterium]|nr:leucine-rich repeat protein [Oscillospiraceae bacterium]